MWKIHFQTGWQKNALPIVWSCTIRFKWKATRSSCCLYRIIWFFVCLLFYYSRITHHQHREFFTSPLAPSCDRCWLHKNTLNWFSMSTRGHATRTTSPTFMTLRLGLNSWVHQNIQTTGWGFKFVWMASLPLQRIPFRWNRWRLWISPWLLPFEEKYDLWC